MALKLFVKTLDEVDEQFQELYEQTDDGYMLQTDDGEYKRKLDEFRTNNRSLFKQKQELEKLAEKYKGVNLEKYEEAMEALKQVEEQQDKDLMDAGKVDELVNKRVAAVKEEYEKQLGAKNKAYEDLTTERDNLRGRLGSVLVDTTLSGAIQKIGKVRQGAMDDVLGRGRRHWVIDEEGQMVPRDEHGETMYGPKGDVLTPDEWATKLVSEAPHLFEAPQGGGGSGGDKKGGQPGKRVISGSDPMAFGQNLAAIAKGEAVVERG